MGFACKFMNVTERETIILNTAWQHIDGMVNRAMLTGFRNTESTTLLPHTREHALLFLIRLRDFLSQVGSVRDDSNPFELRRAPINACPTDRTYIFHLRQVCNTPCLGKSVEQLGHHTEAFADWLEGSFQADSVNLADIDLDADLRVERYRYLQMCGDIAKHSLPRLSVNARHLRRLLEEAGHKITEEQSYLAIPNFFSWFFDDCFNYSLSRIAEYLNEIRWAIFEYLQPEFRRAWYRIDDVAYGYRILGEIERPVARAIYWELMNRVRAEPWIPRFTVTQYLKMRH